MTNPLQNPGVSGLAQLGRNAIERVTELEARIAMTARAIDVDERVQIGDLLSRLHALLAANRDLQSHFDALKADYDAMKLSAEQAKAETDRIRVVGRPADTGFIPVVAAPVPVPKIAGVAK